MLERPINLMASVSPTGYGVTGYHIGEELNNLGWEIALFAKGPTERAEPHEQSLVNTWLKKADEFNYAKNVPTLNIWHQHDLASHVGKGPYFAWPIFELDTFTKKEECHMQVPDHLIVCSQWAKDMLVKNLVRHPSLIHVCPLGVGDYINWPYSTKSENTVFLNAGKWEIRKGHDILTEIFNKAFKPKDKVELHLCPHNFFLSAQEQKNWASQYKDTPMGDHVTIHPWQKEHKHLIRIMSGADCGIFPSRAEGWNLELLEMLSLGKHVITTNYSAHTEFCNSKNALLVDITEVEPAYDGQWFFEQGNWAKIGEDQIDQFVEHMRAIHRLKQEGILEENREGIITGQTYTWENSAKKLEKILELEVDT